MTECLYCRDEITEDPFGHWYSETPNNYTPWVCRLADTSRVEIPRHVPEVPHD